MSICLTDEEIAELTGKKHRDAQRRVLVALGIEHRVRPDGSIVVSRDHFKEVLGGKKSSKALGPVELAMRARISSIVAEGSVASKGD